MVKEDNWITGQISQILLAVENVAKDAGEYQGDADRIIMAGVSSGAHLAVRVAQIVSDNKKDYDFEIKAILDFNGPCDLEFYHMPRAFSYIVDGKRWVDSDNEVKKIDPIRFVNSNMPPTLVIHGTKDSSVPFRYAENFYNALIRNGVKAEFYKVNGGKHTVDINKYGPVAIRFLEKYV